MSSLESYYKEYNCDCNAPLSCKNPIETAQQIRGAKFCLECGFPATITLESEIKGERGSYKITEFLGVRGLGRLYAGIQLNNQEAVIIKEYLLPERCFNQEEALQRKETFKRVGGVNLADGRQQNFRLIQTWEAIADEKGERCFLITKDTEPCRTAAQYLIDYGAMNAPQVREFLNQALQTLVFLHTQKLCFPSNQVQKGLEHGNINLDSILIKLQSNQQFFSVYFCDLAKWENLFIPPSFSQPPVSTYKQDLESLGTLAFYLWLGRTKNHHTGKKIDPAQHELLPNTDNELKQFIYRLLGFDACFQDADTARQALLKLSVFSEDYNIQYKGELQQNRKRLSIYKILLILIALLLLAGGLWYYFWQRTSKNSACFVVWNKLLKDFSEVSNVPTGNFFYTGEKEGTWSFILRQAPVSKINLNTILTTPKPEVAATFNFVQTDIKNNSKKLIEEVKTGGKDFAVTSLENIITNDMKKEKIGYDGLLVYVTFSKNNDSLPQALRGRISLEQLRQIYTGRATNWKQILPKHPDLAIKAYVPQEAEAVEKFKQIVLNDNDEDINLFNEKIAKINTENTGSTQIKMRQAINNGENSGIISFGILSKTWNQCSGYPLAIVNRNNQSIQPLFRLRTNRPINPSDNLCDKANYFNVSTFQSNKTASYPLGYHQYVVYPKDNNREPAGSIFADILKTQQGQRLLYKVGLVPLQPIPNDTGSKNACQSVSKSNL